MDVLGQIEELYPIVLNLPYVDANKTLKILWDESLTEGVRREIEQEMKKIPLFSEEGQADLEVKIGMERCNGEEKPCLVLRSEEQCFYFVQGDVYMSLLWTLYALAQDLPFAQRVKCAKVNAVTYSANQQALASSLLALSEHWQGTLPRGVLSPILKDLVSDFTRVLIQQAPRFASRPVTEDGWAEIQSTMHLIPKKRQVRLRKLAAQLFGEESFEEEINAYCRMLNGRTEFSNAVNSAVRSAKEKLCRLPLMEFEVRLRDAIYELKAELSVDNEREAISKALDKKVDIKKLTPEQIQHIFRAVDTLYEKNAERKVKAAFLEVFVKRLSDEIAEAVPSVLSTMQSWNRQLRPFCKIGTVQDRLNIGWNCCGELSPELLHIEGTGWNERMLHSLQTTAGIQGQYFLLGWLCSPSTYDESREKDGMFINNMYPVTGLTEQLVVAFMAEMIQERHVDG